FVFAHKISDRGGDDIPLDLDGFSPEVFSECNVRLQGPRPLAGPSFAGFHVDHIELSVQAVRHAGAPGNELLRRRIRADTYGDPLTHAPVLVNMFALEI